MDISEALLSGSNPSRHPWERARARIIRLLLRGRLLPVASAENGGAILDVGCGDGFVLNRMASDFPHRRLIGVDSALTSELMLRLNADNAVKNVSLHATIPAALSQCSGPIDCVLLLDVLEHLADEEDVLKPLFSSGLIHNNTIFVITAPAFNALFSDHDRFLHHFRRYNCADLAASLSDRGLQTIVSGYFFSSLLIPRCIQIVVQKITGRAVVSKQQGIAAWRPVPVIDNLICIALYIDGMIGLWAARLRLPIPGLSVFSLCIRTPL